MQNFGDPFTAAQSDGMLSVEEERSRHGSSGLILLIVRVPNACASAYFRKW